MSIRGWARDASSNMLVTSNVQIVLIFALPPSTGSTTLFRGGQGIVRDYLFRRVLYETFEAVRV
jgi:hypothetical protein